MSQGPGASARSTPTSSSSQLAKRKNLEVSPNMETASFTLEDVANEVANRIARLLDNKLKKMATKEDIQQIASTISTLQNDLEATQSKLVQTEARCSALERQVEMLTKKATEKNVIMHIKKSVGLNPVEEAKAACEETLKSKSAIEAARLLRTKNQKTETVVIELQHARDVQTIMQAATELKTKGVAVHRDYPMAARIRRNKIIGIQAEILSKCQALNPKVKGEKLLVKDKIFRFVNGILLCGEQDGYTILQQMVDSANGTTAPAVNNESTNPVTTNTQQNNLSF